MKEQFEQPKLVIMLVSTKDVISTSGDEFEEDPWGDGMGDDL